MNKWIVLIELTVGLAAIIIVPTLVFRWLAIRYERKYEIGPDDGGTVPPVSPIDHVAIEHAWEQSDGSHDS